MALVNRYLRFIEDYIYGFALSQASKYLMQSCIYYITGLLHLSSYFYYVNSGGK